MIRWKLPEAMTLIVAAYAAFDGGWWAVAAVVLVAVRFSLRSPLD